MTCNEFSNKKFLGYWTVKTLEEGIKDIESMKVSLSLGHVFTILVFILLLLSAVLDSTEGAQIDSYAVWYASVDSAGIDSLTSAIDWSK